MTCRYSRQLTSQLTVLHSEGSDLAALHFHISHDRMVLLLKVFDGITLALVFGNGFKTC